MAEDKGQKSEISEKDLIVWISGKELNFLRICGVDILLILSTVLCNLFSVLATFCVGDKVGTIRLRILDFGIRIEKGKVMGD
jgi:hypothetical protein